MTVSVPASNSVEISLETLDQMLLPGYVIHHSYHTHNNTSYSRWEGWTLHLYPSSKCWPPPPKKEETLGENTIFFRGGEGVQQKFLRGVRMGGGQIYLVSPLKLDKSTWELLMLQVLSQNQVWSAILRSKEKSSKSVTQTLDFKPVSQSTMRVSFYFFFIMSFSLSYSGQWYFLASSIS